MRLTITLQSDLCVSSGKGWSSAIDNDVCFDKYGLPFIPARRIKGCLKAAAEFMEYPSDRINRIFGTAGAGFDSGNGTGAGQFRISDARIDHYPAVCRDIAALHITPETVMELFCDVRSSTQIEDDTAKDNSLRFVRVVNRLSPFESEENDEKVHPPLIFCCDVFFDSHTPEEDIDLFDNCCKALRSMGYKRNRGLGAVRCSLDREHAAGVDTVDDFAAPEPYDTDKNYLIEYKIRLDADVAVSRSDTGDSEDFIPGSAVLGAAATKFAALPDNDRPDFNKVFFSGKVKFGNLYIVDKYGEPTWPAPFYLAKYKDSDEIVNMLSDSFKNRTTTKTPKPFKNGYISRYAKAKAELKVTYHHAHNDKTLYTQRCIESGQVFSGRIYASGEYAELIVGLLRDGSLSLGRSRTAQYASCSVISLHCAVDEPSPVSIQKGTKYAAILRTDLIPSAGALSSQQLLRSVIGEDCPVKLESAYLLTRNTEGYNAKWNLKKPHRMGLKAGSALIFTADSDCTLKSRVLFAGEKQNEGCGMVEIISDADQDFRFEELAPKDRPNDVPDTGISSSGIKEAYDRFISEKKILSCAVAAADREIVYFSQIPNNSQLGRLSLMADNSLKKQFTADERKKEGFRWNDFILRVKSIKSEGTREKDFVLIRKFESVVGDTFQGDDSARLKCMIIFLHILRSRAKSEGAQHKRTFVSEGGAE